MRTAVGEADRTGKLAGSDTCLTPSTPFASPQVISRCFACFRTVESGVAGQGDFCRGFDSRQLHHERAAEMRPFVVLPDGGDSVAREYRT
jgi:hypothetical protein